jgi:hypothetical protein
MTSPLDFQSEQARQLVEKYRIQQSLNFTLKIVHHYIKDCIDMKLGAPNEADSNVWDKKLLDAEAGRMALVSTMKRLNTEFGMNFDISAES